MEDDKIILGGRQEFMSHFCTFFEFNACYSAQEARPVRNLEKKWRNPDSIDESINNLLNKMDQYL